MFTKLNQTKRNEKGERARGMMWDEAQDWARREQRAMERALGATNRWRWPIVNDGYPLEDLLASKANLRVLRILWWETRPCWPTEIARGARMSRASVHAVLRRFARWSIVERTPAWNSRRAFAYRLRRRHPLVQELKGLFRVEAKIRFESMATKRRAIIEASPYSADPP